MRTRSAHGGGNAHARATAHQRRSCCTVVQRHAWPTSSASAPGRHSHCRIRGVREKERAMRAFLRRTAGLTLSMIAMLSIGSGTGAQTTATTDLGGWRIAGRDLNNSRSQRSERKIGTQDVGRLVAKWVFTTGSDVSATPTVAGNSVDFPDWAGNLFAVRADTGKLLWSHRIEDYNGRPGSISRVSPAIYNNEL